MLQRNLTYGQTSCALHQYLLSLLHNFAGPYLSNINCELIDTKFSTLLKEMSEIKPNRNFVIEYSTGGKDKPIGRDGYPKLFPGMKITVHSGPKLEAVYELAVKEQAEGKIFSVEDREYMIFSSPVEKMLFIQDDEKTPLEPIRFDLPVTKPKPEFPFFT